MRRHNANSKFAAICSTNSANPTELQVAEEQRPAQDSAKRFQYFTPPRTVALDWKTFSPRKLALRPTRPEHAKLGSAFNCGSGRMRAATNCATSGSNERSRPDF